MNTPQPKPVPTIATKAKIYQMYRKLPTLNVRQAIQYAVDKVNEESNVKYSQSVKTLNSRHIAIIIDELGDAPGYKCEN